ncbi:MAG: DUF1499 domain-containing protein [Balneolaceae bacterium]
MDGLLFYLLIGTIIFALLILLTVFGPFKGSVPGDAGPASSHIQELNPCPDSPNCTHTVRHLDGAVLDLLERAEQQLHKMGAESVTRNDDSQRIDAVFRIPLFGFRDDVILFAEELPNQPGTRLHIRSASRDGYGDVGVNRRRVRKIVSSIQ